MKKILIIPDIHHKVKIVEAILYKEAPDKVIFLGDWFDDFGDNTDISEATAVWLTKRMDKHPEDVFLWGNHDTSYGFPSRETYCSGFSEAKMHAIRDAMTSKHWDKFVFTHWEESWLFSHAGLTAPHISGAPKDDLKGWLEGQEAQAQLKLRSSQLHWFFQAGMSRGGRAPFGGVTWCDVSEFIPTANVNQVFGHTPQSRVWKFDTKRRKGAILSSDNYCIDTHLWHYGLMIDGVFSIGERPVETTHQTVRHD